MSEVAARATQVPGDGSAASFAARLAAIDHEITHFRPRQPHEHPNLIGGEVSIPLDRLFTAIARGRGALDVAIGEGLAALCDGDRLMDLGYSKPTDYARERLGLALTTARDMVKLARGLRERPLLRDAVRAGKLSARKAQEVLPVARGEAEGPWLLLAGGLTVRALRKAVARARGLPEKGAAAEGAGPDAVEEPWKLLSLPLRPEDRAMVEEAMRLAGELLGRGAPAWQRLEAIAQEFLGAHPTEPRPDEFGVASGPRGPAMDELERLLEEETRRWDWLLEVDPVAAPELGEGGAAEIDARLRALVEQRASWDLYFGAVARLFGRCGSGTWKELCFASFPHYARERLGMGVRAVQQRAWLERRLEDLPPLRYAFEEGELSYEKARLVAGVADGRTVHEWIRRASRETCAELDRSIAAAKGAQACARERFEARVPARVEALVEAALRAACGSEEGCQDPAGCLARVAGHFVATWGPVLRQRSTPERRVLERDRGYCQVPGCSRPAVHSHHVRYRSLGGGDEAENLVSLCAPHHLRGVHTGRVRVSGKAPDGLVWELGSPPAT